MGPPPFSGGNRYEQRQARFPDAASMGPPPFSGGNSITSTNDSPYCVLQWGPHLSAGETEGFDAGTTDDECFNGAPTFQRGKLAGGRDNAE